VELGEREHSKCSLSFLRKTRRIIGNKKTTYQAQMALRMQLKHLSMQKHINVGRRHCTMAQRRQQRGFSLIELLIVVAIILIIAAIAVPSFLRARIAANESSAVASVRNIRTSEALYTNAYPSIGYAMQLGDMGGPTPCTLPTSTAACVLDDPIATAGPGTAGKSGYVFTAIGVSSGGGSNDSLVIGAAPASPGITGTRLFCTTNDSAIRADPGPSGVPVTTIAACLNYSPI
jgi:type IV pilus assembly protein PilA